MEEAMPYSDFIPRMEKWLAARGLPAEEILFCTQFVHSGDPQYIITAAQEGDKKDQATPKP